MFNKMRPTFLWSCFTIEPLNKQIWKKDSDQECQAPDMQFQGKGELQFYLLAMQRYQGESVLFPTSKLF